MGGDEDLGEGGKAGDLVCSTGGLLGGNFVCVSSGVRVQQEGVGAVGVGTHRRMN